MSDRIPFRVKPMLATLVAKPFHEPGWVYEEKYDGYRLLAYKEGSSVTLLSRNGNDRTASFAAIAAAIKQLRARTLLLDGEAVAFDRQGLSRFQLLQQGRDTKYAVFDCLYFNGRDLRREPLSTRRTAMEQAIDGMDGLIASRRLADDGFKAFEQARKLGFEGLVGKDQSAPYIEGRSRKWLKVKVHQEEEFVIGGYTAPAGSRKFIGALLLGAYKDKELHYVGKVGTGFTQQTLKSLYDLFQKHVRQRPPFVDPPRERDVTWLAPKLVAQIAFQEWTADLKLRQPVFLGLRDDKKPEECVLPEMVR
jgi:bifunctional non-homologous end joining protein LigD